MPRRVPKLAPRHAAAKRYMSAEAARILSRHARASYAATADAKMMPAARYATPRRFATLSAIEDITPPRRDATIVSGQMSRHVTPPMPPSQPRH